MRRWGVGGGAGGEQIRDEHGWIGFAGCIAASPPSCSMLASVGHAENDVQSKDFERATQCVSVGNLSETIVNDKTAETHGMRAGRSFFAIHRESRLPFDPGRARWHGRSRLPTPARIPSPNNRRSAPSFTEQRQTSMPKPVRWSQGKSVSLTEGEGKIRRA